MMKKGQVFLDISGEEKEKISAQDIMQMFGDV